VCIWIGYPIPSARVVEILAPMGAGFPSSERARGCIRGYGIRPLHRSASNRGALPRNCGRPRNERKGRRDRGRCVRRASSCRSSRVSVPRARERLWISSSERKGAFFSSGSTQPRSPMRLTRSRSPSDMYSPPTFACRRKSRSEASSASVFRYRSSAADTASGEPSLKRLSSIRIRASRFKTAKRVSNRWMRSKMVWSLVALSMTYSGTVTFPQS